ncbi:MAG: OB-fold nucleic acid binding domain-containing protein, partial [Oscillospiraceae bacterium]|nr:OB-fold nucleic acid binding domain-containing protein [Oscillospiraceae bacterium]
GAFDSLGVNRRRLALVCERMMDGAAQAAKTTMSGQASLFGTRSPASTAPLPEAEEYELGELLRMEREIIGMHLSGHPLDAYERELRLTRATPIRRVKADGENRYPDGETVRVAGFLHGVKTKTTRNGGLMAYASLEDKTESVELLLFPGVLTRAGPLIRNDSIVAVTGKLSLRDEKDPQILVDEIIDLNTLKPLGPPPSQKLFLRLPAEGGPQTDTVLRCLRLFPGEVPVILYCEDTKKRFGGSCRLEERLLVSLCQTLGDENVVLRDR